MRISGETARYEFAKKLNIAFGAERVNAKGQEIAHYEQLLLVPQ